MKNFFIYLGNKLKTLFDAATTDPIKFLKNLIWSADHTERGLSQKKVIGYLFFFLVAIIEIGWLKYAYTKPDWTNLQFILTADLTFVAYVIGMNYAHEKAIMDNKNSSNNTPDNTPAA